MKVLVVGNGAMGSAVSYHLTRLGAQVVVFDPHPPGHDQGSSHGETRLTREAYFEAPEYVPLLKRAAPLWRELERESRQTLLETTGLLIVGDQSSPLLASVESSARLHEIALETWEAGRCRRQLPWANVPDHQRGVWEPGAGFLHVEDCVLAHFESAVKRGAQFRQQRVVEWGESSTGVWVRTDGDVEKGDYLVLAAGAHTGELMEDLGVRLTVHENSLFWMAGDEVQPNCCFAFELGDDFFYGFPVKDGLWKVAHHAPGPELTGDRQFQVSPVCRERIEGFVDRVVDGTPKILKEKTCLYTMSPDGHFLIDQHPEKPRAFILAGFSGHGFKFASVIGEAIAQGVYRGGLPPELKFLKFSRLWA